MGKPVNSPAATATPKKAFNTVKEPSTGAAASQRDHANPKRGSHVVASPALTRAKVLSGRSQDVNTKPSKAVAVEKPAAAATKAKGAAPVKAAVKTVAPVAVKAQGKVPAKAHGKALPQPEPKAHTKVQPKTPPKVLPKVQSAPPAKTAAKPVAGKVQAKPTVKASAKVSTKAPVAPPAKVNASAPAKAVVAVKKPLPAVSKPASATGDKAPGKPIAKPPVKAPVSTPTPVLAKDEKKAVIKSTLKPASLPVAAAPKPVAPKAPGLVVAAAPVAPAVPVKAGRPSSRLAQLTVPSMAQSVASTAAKSSFSPAMATPEFVTHAPVAVRKDPKLANNWKTKPVEQLSDAELMAMPDSEYMNDKQMAYFRLKLAVLKQDILNSAGETTEHLREDTVIVPDPADRATIEEEHALELRTRDRERKLLKKIEQSIMRIDAGDYGFCDETGEPIGVGRLLARPTATLSLEAQQRRELKQKMFGD